jgi:DNA repair protein RadC
MESHVLVLGNVANLILQLQYAIQSNVNANIKCHNHPNGNARPSNLILQ